MINYSCFVIINTFFFFFFCAVKLLEFNPSYNRIQHLESYVDLPVKCTNLKIIDLSSNKIWVPMQLEHVKGMARVITLSLKNNPVAEQARDFSTYSSCIRKYIPSLEFLVSARIHHVVLEGLYYR